MLDGEETIGIAVHNSSAGWDNCCEPQRRQRTLRAPLYQPRDAGASEGTIDQCSDSGRPVAAWKDHEVLRLLAATVPVKPIADLRNLVLMRIAGRRIPLKHALGDGLLEVAMSPFVTRNMEAFDHFQHFLHR